MAVLTRLPDWPQRLDAAIEAARSRCFAYGEFDCYLFAADTVLAITGVDLAASFRGQYDSPVSAARILAGYGSMEAIATSLLGEPVHPARARRGDVVLAQLPIPDGETGDCAGVCTGHYFAFAQPQGLGFVRRAAVRLAWCVG